MSVVYALVGYDRNTERMAFRVELPATDVAAAKQIAGITEEDDTQVGDWELAARQAQGIADLVKSPVDCDALDFFLEPYEMTA